MKQARTSPFGSTIEAFMYPFLLLALLWSIYLVEGFYPDFFVRLGILPKELSGLKGIVFSPLIHSPSDVMHLVNNSLPAAVLFGALVYFYRQVAVQVFFLSWLLTGIFVWFFARDNGSYHIGFSGMIYALAGFLFTSGTLRKFRPLQGISLFVAFIYRKKGPQAPKYQFEIEKELGIEPPDLEGMWNENIRLAQEREEELKRLEEEIRRQSGHVHLFTGEEPRIVYEFKRKTGEEEEEDPEKPDDQSSTSGR